MDRGKLNIKKIKALPTMNAYLDKKYGKEDTPERTEFHAKAMAYYYGELIRETRKEKNLTQEALAQKIGKNRAYIARIEQGKTDLQVSNFILLLKALGLNFNISN